GIGLAELLEQLCLLLRSHADAGGGGLNPWAIGVPEPRGASCAEFFLAGFFPPIKKPLQHRARSELASQADISRMVASAAVAVPAAKRKRHACVEPMGEAEADAVFSLKRRSPQLPSRATRHRRHRRAWSCHGRGDAASRLTIVVVDLRLQPVNLRLETGA